MDLDTNEDNRWIDILPCLICNKDTRTIFHQDGSITYENTCSCISTCLGCGIQIPIYKNICPECYTKNINFCRQCESPIDKDEIHCSFCAEILSEKRCEKCDYPLGNPIGNNIFTGSKAKSNCSFCLTWTSNEVLR